MARRNILLHVHIFKNAGTTFDDTLKRNFGDTFIDHREDSLLIKNKEFLDHFFKENKLIKAFSSHSIFYQPKNNEQINYHKIFFLRDPIERIRSVYNFQKIQPEESSIGALYAKKYNFKDYVTWRMLDESPAAIRNAHTIFLAGMGAAPTEIEKKYKVALQTLKQESLVGIVDRYDESMVVFEEYLQAFFPNINLAYIKRNVTDSHHETAVEIKVNKILSELGEELAEDVIKKNYYDLKLYSEANKFLDLHISQIENFDEKLIAFQQRCKRLRIKN